jgi:hypothetical protein
MNGEEAASGKRRGLPGLRSPPPGRRVVQIHKLNRSLAAE